MGRNIPLGRIAGIKISCSWTVVIIALLYTVSLAQGQFPQQVPGLSGGEYWAAGAFGALLFFLSLLAHEVGHALVARHEGVEVSGIELWLLGGMAKLETSPETPGAELRISVVGPLTSGAVGLLFLGLHHLLQGPGTDGLLAVVFAWLGFINLVLAAFNLLPAAPLDGGRVLAALLWMANGDEARSATVAARVGQVLGAGLSGIGVFLLLGEQGGTGGFWLVLVGWYILGSASAELRRAPLIRAVSGVSAGQAMSPAPAPVPDWTSVEQFLWDIDRSAPYDAFPVADLRGRVVGLLTASVVRALQPEQWPLLRVSDVAFPIDRVLQVQTEAGLLPTLQRLAQHPVADAIVLGADGRIAGLLNRDSVHRALTAHVAPG